MGWQGKVLRIDLSTHEIKPEPLNMEWAETYIGQRGLGSKYLSEEMDPTLDALDPGNKLIFATGPLTATGASTGGRYSVITKGALTGAIACSNSGGQFGAYLKLAGWDMLILEGKSPEPCYLVIEDDDVRILPATDFIWGETVWDTEDKIHAKHQNPNLKIASIGISGENLCRFACIMNDRDRAAGRSGVGAVMGSKNLKAIAAYGTVGTKVANPAAFRAANEAARAKLDPSAPRKRLSTIGTHAMLDVTNSYGSLPTLNCHAVQFDGADKVNVKAAHTPRRSDGRANLQANKAPPWTCIRQAPSPKNTPAAWLWNSALQKRSAGRLKSSAPQPGSARTLASAPSVYVKNTVIPKWQWSSKVRNSQVTTHAPCRAWALPMRHRTAVPAIYVPARSKTISHTYAPKAKPPSSKSRKIAMQLGIPRVCACLPATPGKSTIWSPNWPARCRVIGP